MGLKRIATTLIVIIIFISSFTSQDLTQSSKTEVNPTKTEQSDVGKKTPVPTPTITTQPTEQGFSYEPFSRVAQLSEPDALSGTFVLSKDREEGLYLLNAETMQMQELTTGYINVSEVSPDQTLFAYETHTYENGNHVNLGIDIIDDSGEILQHVNSDGMTYSFMWISPSDFIFNQGGENAPIIRYTLSDNTVQTIYPYYDPDGYSFTGYDHFYSWEFFIIHKNVHNPDFTRVVYPYADSESNSYVLRDTENDINLAKFAMDDYFNVAPKWSRDGDFLALGVDTIFNSKPALEIMIVDPDGNILLTTNFAELTITFGISHLLWSPDNQKLAFSCSINPVFNYEDPRLGILNVNTGTSEIYDIPMHWHSWQFWSPDSRFILFQDDDMAPDEEGVFLFDTENKELVRLIDGYMPIGWLQARK